jgi:hypothetical protein
VVESAEGRSRLYGEAVPAFEPGGAPGLPDSVYVEAFKERTSGSVIAFWQLRSAMFRLVGATHG